MLNIDTHKAVTTSQDIINICKPIFSNTKVTYFDYMREYNDFSRIWLATNPNWTKYLYKNEYVKITQFHTNGILIKNGWYTWDSLAESASSKLEKQLFQQKLFDAKNSYNIMNGIALIEDHISFREYYSFGTHQINCNVINEYLTKKDLFINFIAFFKQEAQKIIQAVDRDRLILPWQQESTTTHSSNLNNINLIKKYYLAGKYRNVYLTEKQYKCFYYLSRGHKIKSIAAILKISPRTVESHIENTKQKLSCNTISDIIQIIDVSK